MADAQLGVMDLLMFDTFPGGIDERCQPMDLKTLGTGSGHNVATPMYPVGAKIRVHRRIGRDHRLPGNAADWERVFMNLLLNAAQAMKDRDSGDIEICSRVEDEHLVIEVIDNGPGIDEAILPKIFTARFSTRSKHAGLGLHIVRTLVEANGASVSAANRESASGAVFTIRAPMA